MNGRKAAGMVSIAIGRNAGNFDRIRDTAGEVFLIKSRRLEEAVAALEPEAAQDARLLCITRTFPEKLNTPISFGSTEHYWLTNLVGDRRIAPASLSRILSIVRSQVESGRRLVILIEGIEYLILENDFSSVLKALNQLCDIALNTSSHVFISVDPVALSQREIAMIERTCSANTIVDEEDQF